MEKTIGKGKSAISHSQSANISTHLYEYITWVLWVVVFQCCAPNFETLMWVIPLWINLPSCLLKKFVKH